MITVVLLQTSSVTPEKWVELLTTGGPIALFVFMVFVLLGMARKFGDLKGGARKIQVAAFGLVWGSVFVLAVVIVIVWWRVNFPSEFVVKGVLRNLRDPEVVSTRQEMYMRVYPTGGKEFEYQWRLITPERFSGDVTLILQKTPGSREVLRYLLRIRPEYYRGNTDIDIAYDRATDKMIITRNGPPEPLVPVVEDVSNIPPPDRRNSSIVYAQSDSEKVPVAELIKGLDADNPLIREKARQDLAARGTVALPEIESTLNSAGSSSRQRVGALAALKLMTQQGRTTLPESLRCTVAKLAATDLDRFARSEATRLIQAGVRPGTGCEVPQPVDELKTSWAPIALAYHPESGLFALDVFGRVYRVSGGARQEAVRLFAISVSARALDLAAGPGAVVVVASAGAIGQMFVFKLAPGRLSQIALPARRFGTGIAMDGDTVYVGTSGDNRYAVEAWDLDSRTRQREWSLSGFQSAGPMTLDGARKALIVSDPEASKISALSLPDGKIQLLSDRVGVVTAVAVSARYYLLGSGGKILFLSRPSGSGENAPPGVQALRFKRISGLTVDQSGDLWVSDFERAVIKGPILLR